MSALSPFKLFIFFLFLSLLLASTTANRVMAQSQSPALARFPSPYFQCDKTFHYKLYLSGIKTGSLTRYEKWNETGASLSSRSYAGILGIGTRFIQSSNMIWDSERGFVATDFHQQVAGFKNREMQVIISDNGHKSSMLLNDKIFEQSFDEYQILDADTIAAQIRLMVISGIEEFSLARQATHGLEHYYFKLHPEKVETIKPWGEVSIIPVTQTGDETMTYWYAPELDYQLVYAKYHSFILPGSLKLAEYEISCDQS